MDHPHLSFPILAPVMGTDKKELTVSVQRLDSSHRSEKEASLHPSELLPDDSWQQGFRKRFPWSGFIALLVVIFSSVGSIIVLRVSNHKSQEHWPNWISPNVILSGLNNAANIAITVAVGEGIAIAWWRKASQGATLKELHHSWAFSMSPTNVFIKYKYFNVMALAAITSKFAIIDGMLYQRATTTEIAASNSEHVNVTATVWTHFPTTGTLDVNGNRSALPNIDFTITSQGWQDYLSGVIQLNEYNINLGGCLGFCQANVSGIGFEVACFDRATYVDYGRTAVEAFKLSHVTNSNTNHSSKPSTFQGNTNDTSTESAYTNLTIFSVQFEQLWPDQFKNYSRIGLTTTSYGSYNYSQSDGYYDTQLPCQAHGSCPGWLNERRCELRPALVSYPVYIQNISSPLNFSALDTNIGSQYSLLLNAYGYDGAHNQSYGVNVLHQLDVHEHKKPLGPTALGGIQQALQDTLGADAQISYNGETGWEVAQRGAVASWSIQDGPESGAFCNYTYGDPLSDIVSQLNTLMFTTAISQFDDPQNGMAYPGNISILATQIRTTEHYKSIYGYLYGALGSTLVCVTCILPAYWGFWELGRDVSLGPFEIANAFRAPVFEPVHGGAGHVKHVLKAVGMQKVRYGEMDDESTHGKKLGFSYGR